MYWDIGLPTINSITPSVVFGNRESPVSKNHVMMYLGYFQIGKLFFAKLCFQVIPSSNQSKTIWHSFIAQIYIKPSDYIETTSILV